MNWHTVHMVILGLLLWHRCERAATPRPPQRQGSEQDSGGHHQEAGEPVGLEGPPPASRATPTAQPPSADRPKPTVECSASVAPRNAGSALADMPDVRAPESAGTV